MLDLVIRRKLTEPIVNYAAKNVTPNRKFITYSVNVIRLVTYVILLFLSIIIYFMLSKINMYLKQFNQKGFMLYVFKNVIMSLVTKVVLVSICLQALCLMKFRVNKKRKKPFWQLIDTFANDSNTFRNVVVFTPVFTLTFTKLAIQATELYGISELNITIRNQNFDNVIINNNCEIKLVRLYSSSLFFKRKLSLILRQFLGVVLGFEAAIRTDYNSSDTIISMRSLLTAPCTFSILKSLGRTKINVYRCNYIYTDRSNKYTVLRNAQIKLIHAIANKINFLYNLPIYITSRGLYNNIHSVFPIVPCVVLPCGYTKKIVKLNNNEKTRTIMSLEVFSETEKLIEHIKIYDKLANQLKHEEHHDTSERCNFNYNSFMVTFIFKKRVNNETCFIELIAEQIQAVIKDPSINILIKHNQTVKVFKYGSSNSKLLINILFNLTYVQILKQMRATKVCVQSNPKVLSSDYEVDALVLGCYLIIKSDCSYGLELIRPLTKYELYYLKNKRDLEINDLKLRSSMLGTHYSGDDELILRLKDILKYNDDANIQQISQISSKLRNCRYISQDQFARTIIDTWNL